MKKYYWDTNLKIRLLGETLFNLLYWMYFPFIAVYFSQTISLKWAGLMLMVPPIISLLFNLIGGYLADTYGRRPIMILGGAIQTGMFAVFALSPSPWLDYCAFLGISVGTALYKPASDAMVADLVDQTNRREVFATFMTMNNLGAVLGPIIGAVLFFEYRSLLLWSCTGVTFFYAVLLFVQLKETMPQREQYGKPSASKVLLLELKDFFNMRKDKAFMYYIVAGMFSVIAIMQLDLYLAVYITEYVPLQTLLHWKDWFVQIEGAEVLGLILGLNGILFVFFVLPITKWLKSWTDERVFILSCLLAGLGMFAVGFTTNIWILFFLTVIFTFGEIVRAPVMYNFVSTHAPGNARAKYMGAANMQFTLGRFIAPVTVFLAAWLSPIFIFSAILLSALISLILYKKLFRLST